MGPNGMDDPPFYGIIVLQYTHTIRKTTHDDVVRYVSRHYHVSKL
jgi:hypothetical protein